MDSVTGEEFIINWNAHTGSYIYYLKFNWNENEIYLIISYLTRERQSKKTYYVKLVYLILT